MYVCRVGRLNIGQELIGFGLQGHGTEPWMPAIPCRLSMRRGPGQAVPELHSIILSWHMQAGDIGWRVREGSVPMDEIFCHKTSYQFDRLE